MITATTGVPGDPDGYAVTVDHGAARSLAPNGADTVASLSPGPHTVELTGIVGFCALDGENPRSVEIAAGETVSLQFDITCDTPVFQVGVSTTGSELDADGYEVSIDNTAWGWALPDDTILIPNLSSGTHTVALTRVAPNCAVSGEHPRTVDVVDGAGSLHLDVVCHFTITLGVYVESNGGDPDPDGYVATLNDGSRVRILGSPVFSCLYRHPFRCRAALQAVRVEYRRGDRHGRGKSDRQLHGELRGNEDGSFRRDLLVDANTEINLLSADGSRFVSLTNHPDN